MEIRLEGAGPKVEKTVKKMWTKSWRDGGGYTKKEGQLEQREMSGSEV